MAANLVFGQLTGGRAFVRVNANCTINVAANSSVNSDISTTTDQITGAAITKLIFSAANGGIITIARGSNTILNLSGNASWNLKEMGVTLNEFANANITVTMPASSTLLMELTKMYPTGSE